MISLTLTSYGSTLSGHVNIDGFVLSSKLASVYENISSLSNNYLDCDSCGNLYSNSFRLAIDDITSNSYTAYSIVLYTVVSSVKKAVAYYSSDQPIIVKESSDHIHKFIQFSNLGGSITSISLQSISSSSRSSDNNTDGVVHIEDDSTSLDDSYSVYSKSQVDSLLSSISIPTKLSDLANDVGYITSYTETDPTIYSWAKASTKPSYDLDEVSDGEIRKLSNYVPTTRKINGTALSSDITLSLDDVSDGSTRKLSNYVLTSTTVNSKVLSSNITLSLDDVADGSSRKLSNYELKSNLKEGAYVDVDETTMTSSSTNLPTGKAVASYVTSLGYITSSSLPTVNNTTITIKKNSDDIGDSFTTNASSTKTINLGLSAVATSGSYDDLTDKPTIPSDTSDLTNGAGFITSYTETDPTVPSWAKQNSKPTYNLDEVSDGTTRKLSNYVPTSRKVNSKELSSDVTLTLDDISDGSSRVIPIVNNSTITIQKNSSTVDSFTTNASSNKTINISVPTKTSDLTNDSGFIADYLSLIGKSVTIGATGEIGVVYQPTSDLPFPRYENTPNYSSLNSDLVSDGWTLSSTWKSTSDSFIYNNAICYKGTPTGGSSSYYYKSINETSAYTMSQLESAIVKSGHSSYTFETDSNNSITLTSGDPEYDASYPNRKFIYNKSNNKFNVYGTGIETGVVQVPTWLYNAINSYDTTIYDSSSWIFSCGMGFEYSQDPTMNGGNLYTICASNTTYYINDYTFSEYDMYSGLWHRTSTWNSETSLPYGGSESGWFIAIQEDVYTMSNYEYPNGNWVEYSTNIYYNSDNEYMYQYYDSNSNMYGSDPYSCYNTFTGGYAVLTSTNYYHIFCVENQFGAFVSGGSNSSWSGGTV